MQSDTNEMLERLSEELLAQEETTIPEETTEEEAVLTADTDADVSAEDPVSEFTDEELNFAEELPSYEENGPLFTDETLILPNVGTDQGPAFDDPQTIHEPEEPMLYRNFSNGYGRDLPKEETKSTISKSDKIDIGLMIASSGLCLGIIGVLIYWLAAYLK
jgi:hypothetical protein